MSSNHDIMPANLVQIVNAVLQCPLKIYVLPTVIYEGLAKKYQARITLDNSKVRDYCKPILKSLGMFVFESVSDLCTLRITASEKLIQEILDKIPKTPHASKFEGRLKKIFKDVTFSSSLTDTTIEYVIAVRDVNILPLLQVLETMGIDNWEAVDNDTAVAFSLLRIPDIIW